MEFKILNGIKTYAPKSRAELIQYAIDNNKTMVAINAEKILHANNEMRDFINKNIGYPDGIGAVWALQKKGIHNAVKIPGCELWLDVIKTYYKTKSFYLIGGKQDVIDATVIKLKEDFKDINIVNYRNGFISNALEKQNLINDIFKKKPNVVFVAMGSPMQEFLMEEMQQQHPALYQGLGGSFDVYTGHVRRAPEWWVKNNLEWAYRLAKQPSRIKRQLVYIDFMLLLLRNKI